MNPSTQKKTLYLAFLINLISIGGFMMVIPLGADLVKSIHFNPAHIGYLAGGAALFSAISCFLFANKLDSYNRKPLITLLLTARAICLLICGLSQTPLMLMVFFVLTGLFSGPAAAVVSAMVIDITEPKNRGKAMAFLGSAVSIAAIIIVPFTLQISYYASWQINFFIFAALGGSLALLAWCMLPDLTQHLNKQSKPPSLWSTLFNTVPAKAALIVTFLQVFSHFLIITNFANFFQFNLSFPRELMGLLYLAGGVTSLLILRITGKLFDHGWRHQLHLISSAFIIGCLFMTYIATTNNINLLFILFAAFMSASTVRYSVSGGIMSMIPKPQQRAGFMSILTMMTNLATGIAGFVASWLLTTNAQYQLIAMDKVAYLSIFCISLSVLILWRFANVDKLMTQQTA
ncbi:MFS transporter [uncultured Shewanella sp.]|uniref:MFS transporter n=1 Tax=uncultured Shewanella sp. TaxID=173975 RepID=UPI002616257F|nr:MFS transporter [uncultured Shewanella sp.]